MICLKCSTNAVQKHFNTFNYWYCNTCKQEVTNKKHTLLEEAVNILNSNDGLRYMYVTKRHGNVDKLHQHIFSNVDIANMSTLFYCIHPDHVDPYVKSYSFETVYLDNDINFDAIKALTFKKVVTINADTMELA